MIPLDEQGALLIRGTVFMGQVRRRREVVEKVAVKLTMPMEGL
jgi:hypothetical protein